MLEDFPKDTNVYEVHSLDVKTKHLKKNFQVSDLDFSTSPIFSVLCLCLSLPTSSSSVTLS